MSGVEARSRKRHGGFRRKRTFNLAAVSDRVWSEEDCMNDRENYLLAGGVIHHPIVQCDRTELPPPLIDPNRKRPPPRGGGRSCHHQHRKRQLSLIVVLGLRFPCAVVTNRPEIALR